MAYPFVWLLVVPLVATLAAMPLARRVGQRIGLLDHPSDRKLQTRAVPRAGGIGILVGLMAGTLMLLQLAGKIGVPITREVVAMFLGGMMIHFTGVLDDLFDVPAPLKLGAQALAVAAVVSQGVVLDRIVFPGGAVWEPGFLAVPLTAFFLLGFINAINLVDGLDGLAGGIVAIGALALAVAGTAEGNYLLAALSAVLLGAVLGFLPYNLHRKKTFLGDGGSMLLGYLLGVTAIAGVWFSGDSTAVWVALACAAVPILDTVTTIVRRLRNGRRIFHPDSLHLHHRLVRAGLSPRRTVVTILAVTVFAAGQALLFLVDGTGVLIISTTLAAVLAGVQVFHRRRRAAADSDAGFRETVFYLLGAQDGRSPVLDGQVAMAEVIAAIHKASAAERGVGVPEPVGAPVAAVAAAERGAVPRD